MEQVGQIQLSFLSWTSFPPTAKKIRFGAMNETGKTEHSTFLPKGLTFQPRK